MFKEETWDKLEKCYKAYGWGYDWVQNGYCDAYNVGQNVGTEAKLLCIHTLFNTPT